MKLFNFFVFIFFSQLLIAQNYIDGYIVNSKKDTVKVEILKQAYFDRYSKSVTVKKDSITETYSAKNLYGFGFNKTHFQRVKIQNFNNTPLFLELKCIGYLTLYTHHFNDYDGTKTFTNHIYYIKKVNNDFYKITPRNYTKELPNHLNKSIILSEQVRRKVYSYEQIEDVIIKYNADNKVSDTNSQTIIIENDSEPIKKDYSNYAFTHNTPTTKKNKLGWEFSILMSHTGVIKSEDIAEVDEWTYKGKWDVDFGTGIVFHPTSFVSYSFGFKYFKKKYNFIEDYYFLPQNSINIVKYEYNEVATHKYSGVYFRVISETGNGFIGGGFDASFSNKTSSKFTYSEDNGFTYSELNNSKTFAEEFIDAELKNQFDLIILGGYNIELKNINLKPTAEMGIPLSPIYEVPPPSNYPELNAKLSGFMLKFGVIIEFNID